MSIKIVEKDGKVYRDDSYEKPFDYRSAFGRALEFMATHPGVTCDICKYEDVCRNDGTRTCKEFLRKKFMEGK